MPLTTRTVPIGLIEPNPGNPRTSMDEERIAELEASIRADGILDPIRVTGDDEVGYLVESGHRRLEAAKRAGLERVDVIVDAAGGDKVTFDLRALVTNLQREDLNPVDEASAYKRLIRAGLTDDGISERTGVSLRRVRERLALLELPGSVLQAFENGTLPLSARPEMAAIAKASEELAVAVAKACEGKPDWGQAVGRSPGSVVGKVVQDEMEQGKRRPKWVGLRKGSYLDAEHLRLPRKLQAAADTFSDRVSKAQEYLRPQLDDAELDLLRSLGALYEHSSLGNDRVVIVDQKAMDAAFEQALESAGKRLEQRIADAKERKAAQAGVKVVTADTTVGEAEKVKEANAAIRKAHLDAFEKARAWNLELGSACLDAVRGIRVGPMSMDLAKWLAYGAIADEAAEVFGSGLRLCLTTYQTEEPPKKPGGRVKVRFPEGKGNCAELMVQWVEGAKTPHEVVQRVVAAALMSRYAERWGVQPKTQVLASGHGLPRAQRIHSSAAGEPKCGPEPMDHLVKLGESLLDKRFTKTGRNAHGETGIYYRHVKAVEDSYAEVLKPKADGATPTEESPA